MGPCPLFWPAYRHIAIIHVLPRAIWRENKPSTYAFGWQLSNELILCTIEINLLENNCKTKRFVGRYPIISALQWAHMHDIINRKRFHY